MKTLLALLTTAALAAGCAAGSTISRSEQLLGKYEPYIGEPVSHFTAFRIDSWQSVDRDRIILWSGINDAWMVTVSGYCPDLMFTDRIRVTSTGNQVSTFDKIIVGRDTCLIDTIQPIDVRRMKAERAEAREQM